MLLYYFFIASFFILNSVLNFFYNCEIWQFNCKSIFISIVKHGLVWRWQCVFFWICGRYFVWKYEWGSGNWQVTLQSILIWLDIGPQRVSLRIWTSRPWNRAKQQQYKCFWQKTKEEKLANTVEPVANSSLFFSIDNEQKPLFNISRPSTEWHEQ